MALATGTKLGPYEILAPIGAGGMGEVYRARDPRMGRDVAIKVLAERFSERFDREVRAVAALNHPNVCHLYDVGPNYLVLELIEGPTLQERIQQGAVPLDEALQIARQIADALDAAHEKGIVHRDLKPGNIKVKPDGTVKVLDFGLASVVEAPAADTSDLSHSPTLTMGATVAGMIIGTAGYMSPEQAKGRPVDKRADIWSFGVVLYEMLSGRKAFGGEDVAEIVAAVLRADVEWNALPRSTPAHVRALLRRCLEKDPKHRLRDIGDGRWEMEELPPTPRVPGTRRVWLAWGAAAMLAAVAVSVWLRDGSTSSSPTEFALTIVPPPGAALGPVGSLSSTPEVSPDGTSVLYYAAGSLYIRRLDSLEPHMLPGSQQAFNAPSWSPDSKSVAFPTTKGWTKVRVPDGAPEAIIAPLPGGSRGLTWNEQGLMLTASNRILYVFPSSGGEAKPVDVDGQTPPGQIYPEFLPGSDDFLFLVLRPDLDEGEVYLASLRNGKAVNPVRLLKNDTAVRYTPVNGGHILFVRNDMLYSQKLDLKARKLAGNPELVVAGVASGPGRNVGRADFSVSRTGVVAWRPGKAALSQVTTFDRQGRVTGRTGPPSAIISIVLSPDESRLLAFGDRSWLLETGQPARSALGGDWNWSLWSPDGLRLLGSRSGRIGQRFVISSDSVSEMGMTNGAYNSPGTLHDISPDGTEVLSMEPTGGAIISSHLAGTRLDRVPKTIIRTGELLASPHFSPDGRWIVYSALSVESVTSGIFVQPFSGPGLRKQIAQGGLFPEWRKDGKEIVYIVGDGIWSIRVDGAGGALRFGAPQMLFSGYHRAASSNNTARPIAVSRDGSRIYAVQGTEQPYTNMIHVKMGWQTESK